ncbi:S-adenosyl-L-methionine-dependent methyltransferase [Colletotrichum eremochloae]|nr:S-adenosyl-L-methionine-dependent methyltransferase [Colletotrichum eremochloae]
MAQAHHEVLLVPEDEVMGDGASELESIPSSSTSIPSSMLSYRFENGRTYHKYKDGKYILPNDERENERLDMQHEIVTYTLDGELGLAPPCHEDAKVGRVLDVGTGTGIWAIDFGEMHPEAEVLGVDLTPPKQDFVPPNVKFEVDDVEEEWIYSRPFEYIHSRFMNASIANWKEYIKNCYDNLTPGGYLEVMENQADPVSDDGTFPKDCAIAKYVEGLQEASEKIGRVFVDITKLKGIMEEVGFVDVELRRYKWPMNTWPKDERYKTLGLWCLENFRDALEAVCMALFTRVLNWSSEEVTIFLIDVRKDLHNTSYHAYFNVYCLVGRKPEDAPSPA